MSKLDWNTVDERFKFYGFDKLKGRYFLTETWEGTVWCKARYIGAVRDLCDGILIGNVNRYKLVESRPEVARKLPDTMKMYKQKDCSSPYVRIIVDDSGKWATCRCVKSYNSAVGMLLDCKCNNITTARNLGARVIS